LSIRMSSGFSLGVVIINDKLTIKFIY
jgi:hypothetical protein